MKILIMARQEHLRLAYRAVLEIKGYSVTDTINDQPSALLVDCGDELYEHTQSLKNIAFDNAVFIVSPDWAGKVPQIAVKITVLRSPVNANAILKALEADG